MLGAVRGKRICVDRVILLCREIWERRICSEVVGGNC